MPLYRVSQKARFDLRQIGLYTERVWGRRQRREYLNALDEIFGILEQFAFVDTYNCQAEPVRVTISRAWKKSACIMHVLNGLTPTYKEGQLPRPAYTFCIFDSDRPDKVFRNVDSGASVVNPLIYVRPEILTEMGSERDGSNVCDHSF